MVMLRTRTAMCVSAQSLHAVSLSRTTIHTVVIGRGGFRDEFAVPSTLFHVSGDTFRHCFDAFQSLTTISMKFTTLSTEEVVTSEKRKSVQDELTALVSCLQKAQTLQNLRLVFLPSLLTKGSSHILHALPRSDLRALYLEGLTCDQWILTQALNRHQLEAVHLEDVLLNAPGTWEEVANVVSLDEVTLQDLKHVDFERL